MKQLQVMLKVVPYILITVICIIIAYCDRGYFVVGGEWLSGLLAYLVKQTCLEIKGGIF